MSDTVTDTSAAADPVVDPVVDPAPAAVEKPAFKTFAPPPPRSAKDRLRAFEDKHLGHDVQRIDGVIERGHGSAFKALPAEKQAEYVAIEKLVEAEAKVASASADLEAAKVNLAAATRQADLRAAAAKEPAA